VFNVLIGQTIAIGIVSGGIFTKNLEDLGVHTPMLQLAFIYTGLAFSLIYFYKQRETKQFTKVPLWKYFLCSVVDVHATLCIVLAFTKTSLTSVMIIQDFTIPSAVLLSLFFLKIRYMRTHFIAISICLLGIGIGFCNDFFIIGRDQSPGSSPVLGDCLELISAFLYALENVLCEHLVRTDLDVYQYIGWLGVFGMLITYSYAFIFNEYAQLANS
jgi:solute carrier family 35 protein F1/2